MPDIPNTSEPRKGFTLNATDPESWADAYSTVIATNAAHLVSMLLTCVIASVMYFGYYCLQTGSFDEAIRHFFTSKQAQEIHETKVRADHLQAEIVATRDANIIIQQTLKDLLDGESGGAIRARGFSFHNGTDLTNLAPVMRYDIAYGYAERGRSVGDLDSNLPLSNFTSTLPDLIAGRCKIVDVNDLLDVGAKNRMQSMGITESLTCPIHDGKGHLLGALGISWDEKVDLKSLPELPEILRRTQAAADKIGIVLSLMPKSLPHPPGASKD